MRILLSVSAFALGLSALACGSDDGGPSGSKAEGTKTVTRQELPESSFTPTELEQTLDELVEALGAEPFKAMTLSVVMPPLSEYWEPAQVGAKRALDELGVDGGVVVGETADDQVRLVEEAVDAGNGGVAIAPLGDELTNSIETASDEDIPVVTFDRDLADSKRSLHLGTENYDAGHTAAETLLGRLAEGSGTVYIYGEADPSSGDGYERTMGAKDALEVAGYTVTVRTVSWDETGEAVDVEAMADGINNSDPPVVGMLGVFANSYRCALAAELAGKTPSDVAIVGFELDPTTISYMRSGMIGATHTPRTYYMGYLAPYALYAFNVLGAETTFDILSPHMVDATHFDVGLDVVRADQVDEYASYVDSFGSN